MRADKFKLNPSFKNSKNLESDAKALTDAVHTLDGINAVRVDPIANTITVDYNEDKVSKREIKQKLKENNYTQGMF